MARSSHSALDGRVPGDGDPGPTRIPPHLCWPLLAAADDSTLRIFSSLAYRVKGSEYHGTLYIRKL